MSLTIQLDQATAEAVQELAAEQQRSADEVVREALSAYVRSAKRVLPKGIGKYHSGRSDVSTQARIPRRFGAARIVPWRARIGVRSRTIAGVAVYVGTMTARTYRRARCGRAAWGRTRRSRRALAPQGRSSRPTAR